MGKSLPMKTSRSNTKVRIVDRSMSWFREVCVSLLASHFTHYDDCRSKDPEPCPWPMPDQTPMVVNVRSECIENDWMSRSAAPTHPPNFDWSISVFLCTADTSWLDGKHVVFGKVISGLDVVSAIEQVGSESGRTRVQGTCTSCVFLSAAIIHSQLMLIICIIISVPLLAVVIADSGQLR